MNMINRRTLLGTSGAVLATPAFAVWPPSGAGMPKEAADTPHICLGPIPDAEINAAGIRRYTQLGLTHMILNGSGFPWNAETLKDKVKTLKDNGITAGDIGLPWQGANGSYMRDIIYARPGRDKAIEDVKSAIRAASAAGISIVEYNFYVHRANEAYYQHPDPARGGAVVESVDGARMQGVKLLEDEVVQQADATWANLKYFIDAVVPAAEAANVRLALHPNDPPVPVSAGSPQIMSTLAGWKRMADIRKSPANCIIFDCGVTRELGENPVEVARYFGQRDQIGHVHYRNVQLRKPYVDYTEVYPDNGDNNMLAVMKALVAAKYKYMIFPEHARGLDVDRDFKTNNAAAWAFHVGYARAMLQAALMER